MDSSNGTAFVPQAKRSVAALFLQISISFLVFNVGVVNSMAEGWLWLLQLVTSPLLFVATVDAARKHFLCAVFPVLSIYIFIVFLAKSISASRIPPPC